MAADLVYDSQELDSLEEVQEFCRRSHIPHLVVLSDKEQFFERKQVKVRMIESGGSGGGGGAKGSEKLVNISELADYLQQKQGVERSDSLEGQGSSRAGGPSNVESFPSNARPPVNVTVVAPSKLTGHLKRKLHDQVGEGSM